MADWSQTPIEHKPPKKRLVLFSGGFDSVVLLERLIQTNVLHYYSLSMDNLT